jgi:uncharacterized protein YdiU (UPF0061 family)
MILKFPTYLNLPSDFFQINSPGQFLNSECRLWNAELDNELQLTELFNFKQELLVYLKNGQSELIQKPFSQAYMGHQFGSLNMLGDGRAHMVAEFLDTNDFLWDVQLKGSGRSQFSRRGDGVAALGPMLREMIISEAMNALMVPTTRSLAVIATNETVVRQKNEPGGILVRISKSHVRVGTFQFAYQSGGKQNVQKLADYMLERMKIHYDQSENKYRHFFKEVVSRQSRLIAQWLSIGFIHGVMNTDNMSIIGETIDYGPCAFMDQYHPMAVFSSIDQQGRYAYMRQVEIAQWNLARLAETLLELFSEKPEESKNFANLILNDFIQQFQSEWFLLMSKKIGFQVTLKNPEAEKIWQLVIDLLDVMMNEKLDFTNTFLFLTGEFKELEQFKNNEKLSEWKNRWLQLAMSMSLDLSQMQSIMKNMNPLIIPRNYLVEEVIQKAIYSDYSSYTEFLFELQSPFQQSEVKKKMQFLPNTTNTNYQTFCGT